MRTANGRHRSLREERGGHLALEIIVAVEEGQGGDCTNSPSQLGVSSVLKDDSICGPSHVTQGSVLQSSDTGVGRKGVKEDHLEESLDVRK